MNTKDFGLIACLAAKRINYTSFETDELGRIWFTYPDGAETEQIRQQFYSNTLYIPVQDLINAQNTMKTLIFELRTKENAYGNRKQHEYDSRKQWN